MPVLNKTEIKLPTGTLEIATEHVTFSGNVFYNAINNFIYYRKLSSTSGGDSIITEGSNQFFAFQFDQNNATLYGAEANLDIHPHPLDWLHIENTFSANVLRHTIYLFGLVILYRMKNDPALISELKNLSYKTMSMELSFGRYSSEIVSRFL